jgi:hypothetical protein
VCNAVAAVLALLPSWTAPSWVTSLPTTAATVGSYMGGFQYWLPWEELVLVTGAVLGLFLIVSGARLVLWLWSLVPVIGSGK